MIFNSLVMMKGSCGRSGNDFAVWDNGRTSDRIDLNSLFADPRRANNAAIRSAGNDRLNKWDGGEFPKSTPRPLNGCVHLMALAAKQVCGEGRQSL